MKIGIDISQIVYGTGVSRYTEELVKKLVEIDKNSEYILFGSSLRQRIKLNSFAEKIKSENVSSIIYPLPPTFLEYLFNRVRIFDIQNLIGKVGVFHSSDWTQPKTKACKVTTIHDLGIFKFPELFDSKIVQVQKRRLNLVKKECDAIIAVSENTKKETMEFLGIPEEKITVIYEGVSDHFSPKSKKSVESVKKKFGIKNDYLMAVATFGARKNMDILIKSYKEIKDKNIDFVVAGLSSIESNGKIHNIGFVTDEELAALYSGARLFIHPSRYEGFGLPVLEAMSCGTPVLCSDITSLKEIGGSAVLYVNPENTVDMACAINNLLDNDQSRKKLIELGYNRSKFFSWQKAAEETIKVYKKCL